MTTTRSGSAAAGRRNRTALTQLNMVAFTAMPKANVNTAIAVTPRFLDNIRRASFTSERKVAIDAPHRRVVSDNVRTCDPECSFLVGDGHAICRVLVSPE